MSYLFNILRTGAVRKTPQKVILSIANKVRITNPSVIIELGAGNGEITETVFNLLQQPNKVDYYAFEISQPQCTTLKRIHNQVKPICKDALDFRSYIPPDTKADFIISSLPLSFFPKAKVRKMLLDAKASLKQGGTLYIVFTAPWLTLQLNELLPSSKTNIFLSLPPYLLLTYQKPNE